MKPQTILYSKWPNWLIINVFKITFYIWVEKKKDTVNNIALIERI